MMRLYAVRDVKADAFGAPMSIATKGLALRSFSDACSRQDSDLYRYPEDYMLYEIGEYEPNTGTIIGHQLPQLVITASAIREQSRVARLVHEPELIPKEVA